MDATTHQQIRQLLDDYLRMYAGRDDRLTELFSADFSGFTGGGDFLVKDRARWIEITRQDFAQIKDPIRIELEDVAIQSLSESVAVATSFFRIHLPIKDHFLSRETARLVLIFRQEGNAWKITHSSISIPYYRTREGEVYPLQELSVRNQALESIIAERTQQLSEANESLRQTNEALQRSELRYRSILNASPDDITITDREGRIIMVSPMAFTIFRGRPDAQFQGRPVTDFIVPEDRARAMERITQKRQGLPTGASEYRGLRADGSTLDIEVNSDFIRDASGEVTGMVLIVRDITERKQAEAARARLEAINRRLQKSESLGRMAEAIAHHFNNQLQAVMLSLELTAEEVAPG
jgi:PAS domain S-box-containing protein